MCIFKIALNHECIAMSVMHTCIKAIWTGLHLVIPLNVVRSTHHNVPGEEAHLSPGLELCPIGQCNSHPQMGVLQGLGECDGSAVLRHRRDEPHLVLYLAVPVRVTHT